MIVQGFFWGFFFIVQWIMLNRRMFDSTVDHVEMTKIFDYTVDHVELTNMFDSTVDHVE